MAGYRRQCSTIKPGRQTRRAGRRSTNSRSREASGLLRFRCGKPAALLYMRERLSLFSFATSKCLAILLSAIIHSVSISLFRSIRLTEWLPSRDESCEKESLKFLGEVNNLCSNMALTSVSSKPALDSQYLQC
eukprot:342487-Rhodomonas_salina.2